MVLFLGLNLLSGCSGYRFQQKSNPFAQFGIKSLSIPVFYNKSSLPNVSGIFTDEIYQTLTKFNKLRLISGDSRGADAYLIGIITSKDRAVEVESVATVRSAQTAFEGKIDDKKREDFYIPATNNLGLSLRLIVLKHPTEEEIKFYQTSLSEKALSSKVIFNETIQLKQSYSFKTLDAQGMEVLGTQNRGQQRATIKAMASSAAISFRDMILYAF